MIPKRRSFLRTPPAFVTAGVLLMAGCGGELTGPPDEGRSLVTVTAPGPDGLDGGFRYTAAEGDRNGREVESPRSVTVEGEFRAR